MNQTDISQAFVDLMQPMRELDTQLTAREVELNRELDALREQRRKVRHVLRSADPNYQPKPSGTRPGSKAVSRKTANGELVAEVKKWIIDHREELSDGITGSEIARLIRSNGLMPEIGVERIRSAVVQLHEQDFLRLDRITKGGGKAYKVNE